jgi:hypothetical protein
MNSLKAFLSACAVIDDESAVVADTVNVLKRNGQPARVLDRHHQLQSFTGYTTTGVLRIAWSSW